MLGYLKVFGVFMIWACIALTSHYFITNQIFKACTKGSDSITQIASPSISPTMYITDYKKDTLMTFESGFKIAKNQSYLNINEQIINRLSKLLVDDYKLKIAITGKYTDDEIAGDSSDLGLQRASKVYNQFLSKGIFDSQLTKLSNSSSEIFIKDSIALNGIEIRILQLSDSEVSDIESQIAAQRFYIDFKNEVMEPTHQLIQYIPYLQSYLTNNPDKKAYITGHTANAGYYQNNLEIGRRRAAMVAAYIVARGIPEDRLVVQSMGEAQPLVKKGSEAGKKLNKRIEIQVK